MFKIAKNIKIGVKLDKSGFQKELNQLLKKGYDLNLNSGNFKSVINDINTELNKLRNTLQKAKDMDKEVSRKIDSSVNMFISAMQRAASNENREAIIKGSIIPSASKVIKTAIIDGAVALVNPAIAIILAIGQFAVSKKMQKKERQLVLDEIDIELEMCKRYMRQAEDNNDLEAQKQLLRIQRNLERQKQRIQYIEILSMSSRKKRNARNIILVYS